MKVDLRQTLSGLKLKETATQRCVVESNWKRTVSPYDKKYDSAGCAGESARERRSLDRKGTYGVEG